MRFSSIELWLAICCSTTSQHKRTLPIKYLLFRLSINIHKPLLFLTEKQAWAAACMVRHGKMRAALPLLSLKADISVRDLIKLSYNTMNICTFHNVYTSCIKMRLFVSTQFCGSPTNNFILPHPAHTSLFPSTPALAHQELSCTAPCCVGSRGSCGTPAGVQVSTLYISKVLALPVWMPNTNYCHLLVWESYVL